MNAFRAKCFHWRRTGIRDYDWIHVILNIDFDWISIDQKYHGRFRLEVFKSVQKSNGIC